METSSCFLCGGNDIKIVLQSPDHRSNASEIFTVVSCNQCGLVFQNPRPGIMEIGKYYPETYELHLETDTWRPSQQDIFRKELIFAISRLYYQTPKKGRFSNYIGETQKIFHELLKFVLTPLRSRLGQLPNYKPPGRILEIGCGIGAYLDILSDLGWETYGVEINQKASEIANSKGHQIYCGSLEEKHWPDQYFQAACLWHTLEHLHQPLESLHNIHRLLSNEAELLIEIPNWESFGLTIFGRNWFGLELPRHLYFFTPHILEKLLIEAGFEIVEMSTLPSKFVIQKSQLYLRDELNHKRVQKINGWRWLRLLNWRLVAMVEIITGRGDLLRVRARRA